MISLYKSMSYKMIGVLLFLFAFAFLATKPAYAACFFANQTPISFNLPNYSFYKIVGSKMAECEKVSSKYSSDSATIGQVNSAASTKSANILGVSVNTINELSKKGRLRNLDDLVAKFGAALHERQFIRRNGSIVAIAIAGNTQNLVYHEGIFNQERIEPPNSYSQMIDVIQKLSANQAVQKPFAVAYKNGWNVANEFVNLLLSDNGALLSETNRPAFNNDKGEAALKQMLAMISFIPEEFEKADARQVQAYLAQGQVAMASLWASNAASLDNPEISRVAGRMKFVPLPSINLGGKPASTYWWDGFAISSFSNEVEAAAAFQVALEGIDKQMIDENRHAAIWLMPAYIPDRLTLGVIKAIDAGIPEYPSSEALNMVYKVLGEEIPKFLKGEKSATQTLIDAEVAYSAAARERGLIN